jgi:hypothetical protein
MNDTVDVFTTNAFALLTVTDEQAGNGGRDAQENEPVPGGKLWPFG